MNPKAVAERYFAAIKARDADALRALYAEDAVFTLPNGKQFAGADAICDMHRGVFAAGAPVPAPLAMVVGENAVAVRIEARLPDGTARQTANFYELNSAGRIQKLSVYMQG